MHSRFISNLAFVVWLCCCQVLAIAQQPKVLRIGMCSDVHLPTMHDGAGRLTAFLDSMRAAKPDFIIELGDFVTPAPQYAQVFALWTAYQGTKYHVIGNHEMDAGYTLQQALDYRGMRSSYYAFKEKGFNCIVLDGNDKKTPGETGYREYIGFSQQVWLKQQLAAADGPVIIFSHQGIGPTNGISNQIQIRELLEKHNSTARHKVIACFNGHTHGDAADEVNGIWYITINSMSYKWLGESYAHVRYSNDVDRDFKWIKFTAPYKDPLFTVVEISTAGYIRISGKKSVWVGPSPWDLGYPEAYRAYVRPEIKARELRFKPLD